MKKVAVISAAVVAALVLSVHVRAAEEHKHEHGAAHEQEHAEEEVTVTGEVLDMACYIGHGAMGADHAKCAKTCIESGLPVGIKATDGKTYLIIGDHKPLNSKLAAHAAKTITVKGKHVERDGIHMIANAEIVK